jgi:hypothetical protein
VTTLLSSPFSQQNHHKNASHHFFATKPLKKVTKTYRLRILLRYNRTIEEEDSSLSLPFLLQQNQKKRKEILCYNKTRTKGDINKVVVIFFIAIRPKQNATTFYATIRKKNVKTTLLLLPSLL